MNFREQFIKRDIATLEAHAKELTEWETTFLASIKQFESLSTDQFNILQEIASKLKGEK